MLRIRYTDLETAKAGLDDSPFRRSWEVVELRTSNTNPHLNYCWYDCFTEMQLEVVALLLFGRQGLESVFVNILRIDHDGVIYAGYLLNIFCFTGVDVLEFLESYVNGQWMSIKWCVG
jgi:hypothetical protein